MANYKWFDLMGEFESIDNGRVYKGREFDAPTLKTDAPNEQGESQDQPTPSPPAQTAKKVWVGQSISNQRFKDGTIKVEIEFEQYDPRCLADIILQYDPNTKDMVTFSLGGDVPEAVGMTFYALRLLSAYAKAAEPNVGTTGSTPTQRWKTLATGGERQNLKAGRKYDVAIFVRGSSIRVLLDDVEVIQHVLPFELPGLQVGIFCAGPKDIYFRNFMIGKEKPQAFVVMQFNTPEYEALFAEVITPVCEKRGSAFIELISQKVPASLFLTLHDI